MPAKFHFKIDIAPGMQVPNLMEKAIRHQNEAKESADRKIEERLFQVFVFPQLWGSSALGFSGIGQDVLTQAETAVLYEKDSNTASVFFNGRFAYFVCDPNQQFFADIQHHNMKAVKEADEYKRYTVF